MSESLDQFETLKRRVDGNKDELLGWRCRWCSYRWLLADTAVAFNRFGLHVGMAEVLARGLSMVAHLSTCKRPKGN